MQGFDVEFLNRDDYGRIAEFDALFIRETTSVNHHTYRFASRARAEGMVVMDDPESIIRCGNKVYLFELAKRLDLAIPPTMVVSGARTDDIIKELGLPCVLKQPDSAFSEGVFRADTREALCAGLQRLLSRSDLVVVQSFMPTEFDWRVGIIDRQPLFVCRYYMADGHWQIYHHGEKRTTEGESETLAVAHAPREVLNLALRTANAVGDGFYGVDIKTVNGRQVLMEINDNPSIDRGVEDLILGDELYERVMKVFRARVDAGRQSKANRLIGRSRLFAAYGVELEYMLVHERHARRCAGRGRAARGRRGRAHRRVGERRDRLEQRARAARARAQVQRSAAIACGLGQSVRGQRRAREREASRPRPPLMPTAMHPWMDPEKDLKLWPHGLRTVYETFDRIFGCKGHGWANLQSAHLNLPFAGDEEFARLHTAVRFLLPILPGLAASSPIVDGERNGILDNRLVAYRGNCARIPSITGDVVPEAGGLDRRVSGDAARRACIGTSLRTTRKACCGTNGSTRAGRSRASSG